MQFEIEYTTLQKIYYTYIVLAIISTFVFLYAKCYFQFNTFDRFLYKGNDNMIEYVLFHIVTYFILGVLFGFNHYIIMLLKTLIIEIGISLIEKCDIYDINISSVISSILIGMISFTFGCVLNWYYFQQSF